MTDHPTTAARDLYAAILREPACDLVRLAYADELDAAGECERAEFIRVQIEMEKFSCIHDDILTSSGRCKIGTCLRCDLKERNWELLGPHEEGCYGENWFKWFGNEFPNVNIVNCRRGFVDSVAMTMRQFMGGECRHRPQSLPRHLRCQDCNGTGRTPGLASVICAKWPVTEIRLTDREPMFIPPDFYCWVGDLGRHHYPEQNIVPRDLGPFCQRTFKSREEAVTALSRDLVNYGRKAAGLPLMWLGDN